MEIGTTPQFFIDDYVVDNRWAINYDQGSREMVKRVFHAPNKHPGNPLMTWPLREPASAGQPGPSWFSVLRDAQTGDFKIWYQLNEPTGVKPGEGRGAYTTAICYGESKDGLKWTFPKLGLVEWRGSKDNNVVWLGMAGRRAGEQQIITQVPEAARRGYRYLMLYLEGGIHLIGSHDGIHWDRASHQKIHDMPSDFPNNIVYDPVEKEFVMYCRAKTIYLIDGNKGDKVDTGESRRIARMTSKELWTKWTDQPQNILLTDELDNADAFTAFYAMQVQRYAGIYWGFLLPFKWNTDIHAELAFSRDGLRFDRLPTRPKLIPLGPDWAWDSGLIFTDYNWVEVGDEWWLYYNGWDGPHGAKENNARGRWRRSGIGMVTVRKEGFISLRGPENGGVICTRRFRWPGGGLMVNADARLGELKVRVSDELRKVIPGFDYKDCVPFRANQTAHEIRWSNASLDSLQGKVVRLEFYLKNADLYTFRALGGGMRPGE